ncbi:hypothetical protein A3860_25435 [Niastella vici]|uniref:Carbohydrate-binding module family 96 domain-containing protein n=1 Tax=Niastella vici TaxID=1703345 RepID=A0A1V9FY06_9BACT|nr:DNRLRE domain-containing protein [Niastella vici]OQP63235.1 hypothetical protein A3860_25435 [Niastella vici]
MRNRTKKCTAWFFLIIFGIETFFPGMAYALTSGPTQPEMQKFKPAGDSEMVDLFTGNFKYNIPLVDVGGYPLNLSYGSGEGMEDEASWVGFGWSLNPGAINRTVRGLPDDFKGEKIRKDYSRKEFRKIGGNIILKPSLFGWEIGSPSIKVGIYKDNYYGVGAEVGLSLGNMLGKQITGPFNLGLDFTSDNREGATFTPSLSLAIMDDKQREEHTVSLNGSLTYNTRSGLKQISLGSSFSTRAEAGTDFNYFEQSAVKYFGQTWTPSFFTNTRSHGFTFSFDIGATLFGAYVGIGGQGYTYREHILEKTTYAPAFGYMNYLKGRQNTNALIDFNREKEGVYIPGTPSIPIPVATQDIFTATGQAGSLQFRPYFNGNYMVFDKAFNNSTNNTSVGLTVGGGNLVKIGGRVNYLEGEANTGKWAYHNSFLNYNGEPKFDEVAKPDVEPVHFKQTGELTRVDEDYYNLVRKDKTVQVAANDNVHRGPYAMTWTEFLSHEPGWDNIGNKELKKNKREVRTASISYLNANQAERYGLDKFINGEERYVPGGEKSEQHISEITITDDAGKRMVYGIPVYNRGQYEATFSVKPQLGNDLDKARKTGLITYDVGDNTKANNKGRDNLFSREYIPPYATSYLLTGVLSPDYVDLTGNGITDDDLGTAYKFTYNRTTKNFQWRAPYAANSANFNEGFISDPKDDKGSYVGGTKELWYMNTVESKTMIAVFETSDRQDGLGVLGENGGQNPNIKLKKLDRIKLYSKAAWVKDGANAVPIKVVHFEYDYSIHPNVPNNTGAAVDKNGVTLTNPNDPANVNQSKGKLTLKRVYFTFGNNTRGETNPYEFSYDMRNVANEFGNTLPAPNPYPYDQSQNAPEVNNSYAMRQSDRWGTYKPTWYNHLTSNSTSNGALNNSEFPYAIQDNDDANTGIAYNERTLDGLFASMWQLNKIITPTGSTINIEYEADDYGYVQDRRAMQMCFIKGIGNNSTASTGMVGSDGFTVELPEKAVDDNDFKKKYLKGPDGLMPNNIYYKIFTDLNNQGRKEYVQGYAEISPDDCKLIGTNSTLAFIALKKLSGYSPVSKAAWQMLKTELPQFAYDHYDNADEPSFSQAAIKSLVQAVLNMKEFFVSFEKSASRKSFANTIDLSKSMIRLCNPSYNKLGGGSRVRKITIEDAWNEMSHQTGKTAKYGQLYEYNLTDGTSSGVAAYEPQIGNEENPFHEPIPYSEKVHWAPDKVHFIERPFCESYFPSAVVGYSKVTVTNFGDTYAQGGALEKFSGYTEYEFYTAKDFPTLVDNLPLHSMWYENSMLLKLFSATYIKKVVTSQGFKVELNDMHGKPKSVKMFDMGGSKISSVEYFYNVDDENAQRKNLNNSVDIVKPDEGWKIEPALLGMDVDIATDVRESTDQSFGIGVGAYAGTTIMPIGPFPAPVFYGAGNLSYNLTKKAYNSISFVKVIQKYGIVKKVRTEKNGSSITSENLLWDGQTGNVLLTRTENEFNDYTYAFNYPAYWAEGHEGMGAAYKNIGAVFTSFITASDGKIPQAYEPYLVPGDELIAEVYQKGWIIRSTADNSLRFIDEDGRFIATNGKYYVLRSGRRNQTSAEVGRIVCMNNPIVETGSGRTLQFSVANKILDAKAVLYSNEWSVPVPDQLTSNCSAFTPYGGVYGNYTVSSQSAPACRDYFKAGAGSEISRSYLSFSTSSLPAGAQIQSVKLKLKPSTWNGSNASKLERVKEIRDCSTAGQVTWQNQPAVATTNMVSLPAISSDDFVYADLTAMFREWFLAKDIPEFSIRLSLASESGNSFINFWGLNGEHGFPLPELTVCYKFDACVDPIDQVVNPYVKGVLGNWRPKQSFVYMVDREQKTGLSSLPGSTNIRTSGAYLAFNPFWEFQPAGNLHSNVQVDNPPVTERWVWASKSVYYDGKGNEIESVIPINRDRQGNIDVVTNPFRYSTALYGYRESAAIAVATNARHNEIAFDGFEDYNFTLQNLVLPCPEKRHFDWGLANSGTNWCLFGNCLATDIVHSGRYSWLLSAGSVSITKQAGNAAPPAGKPYAFNGPNGEPTLATNELAKGFAPIAGKQYIFSMWVHDGNPAQNKINGLTVSINGVDQQISTKVVPVVEEWKRIECVFTAGTSFNLQLVPLGNIHIDDVRIFPYDANMNSFVYDDRNMRLMAQLDENNFATFYEYDDEGTPIRVKKETERGVMTLKENRQSFRKR